MLFCWACITCTAYLFSVYSAQFTDRNDVQYSTMRFVFLDLEVLLGHIPQPMMIRKVLALVIALRKSFLHHFHQDALLPGFFASVALQHLLHHDLEIRCP